MAGLLKSVKALSGPVTFYTSGNNHSDNTTKYTKLLLKPKFIFGIKPRGTLVYPTILVHTGPQLAFNGVIRNLVLSLKAHNGEKLKIKPETAPCSNKPRHT